MGPEILIPILVPLGAMALAFGLYYLRNKENMTMIEKGMNPKEFANHPAPYRNLKWGLLLVGAGVGLFLAYIMHTYVLKIDDDNPVIDEQKQLQDQNIERSKKETRTLKKHIQTLRFTFFQQIFVTTSKVINFFEAIFLQKLGYLRAPSASGTIQHHGLVSI